MKIEFDKDINGFQSARKLKMILEHYSHSDITDRTTRLFIEDLTDQLNDFISDTEFKKFDHSNEIDTTFLDASTADTDFASKLAAIWHVITGPSKQELLLSKQRHELIERAERAEAIAFEAIAETAEAGRQRDNALERLKQLKNGNTEKDSG